MRSSSPVIHVGLSLGARVLLGAAAAAVLAGCGGGGSSGNACATTGTGTLAVDVVGLPAGVNAAVTVTGPGGAQAVTATKMFTATAAGSYAVTADRVTAPNPIVRTVYTATVSGATATTAASVCVGGTATQTVTVTYAMVPTSNKLWVANSNAPTDDNVQAFASTLLAATGTAAATVATKSAAGRKMLFDRDGNLWAIGGTTGDPLILQLSAATLATSGSKTSTRGIDIQPAIACVPAVGAVAFGPDGALWVSSSCGMKIYKLGAAQVAAGGTATPALTIASPLGGEGLAFDKTGNLWVGTGDEGHLLRFDAASLASAGATPSLTLAVQTAAAADLHPGWLAFDATGNLWTSDFGGNVVFSIPAAQLSGTGTKTVTPPALVTVGVGALLAGMAFDEGGGLWITLGAGSFGRLTAAQLTVTTDAGAPTVPERTITGSGLGYAEDLAFYPAPAALPLFSALP